MKIDYKPQEPQQKQESLGMAILAGVVWFLFTLACIAVLFAVDALLYS
jgi:hypothetical protein